MGDILSDIGYVYGSLNPVQKKKSQPIYSTNSDPLDILRKQMKERYTNDSIKGITRFKSIVLRIENPIGETGDPPMSWADTLGDFFGLAGEPPEIRLVSIKAMIPEIHGSILPTPKTLGNEDGVGADHRSINMYPVFTAQNSGINQPKIGDIVWVTFEDIENLDQGILLGGLNEGDPTQADSGKSSKGAFGPCGRNSFGARAAGGLKIKNINVNIVGNFPDLTGTRTKIDPKRDRGKLPVGKGLKTNMPPTPKRFPISQLGNIGLDWIGVLGYWQKWPESIGKKSKKTGRIIKETKANPRYLKEFVDRYHAIGIRVYVWAYPCIKRLDEMVSFIFPLAHEAGACGVIYDPEDGMFSKSYTPEQTGQMSKDWMDKSMQAARKYGLCLGVTSYEVPHWISPKIGPMLQNMTDADFCSAQSYRRKGEMTPKHMLRGLKDYTDYGFKNMLAFGADYGTGFEPYYPQYGTTQKPPEEIVRRNGWLLGETAQKFIDYKKSFALWRSESLNLHISAWPENRFVTIKNIADEIEKSKKNPGPLNPPMTPAEKEASDASAAEKKVKVDDPTPAVKKSEGGTEPIDTGKKDKKASVKKGDEASKAKKVDAPPKLTKEQQEKLDSLRKEVAAKKSIVEETEGRIEGLSSTAVKGSPSALKAEKLKPTLTTQKAALNASKAKLASYEKELGIKHKAVQPSPQNTSPRSSVGCRTGAGASGGSKGSGGKWVKPPSGNNFKDIKEYKYDNTKVSLLPAESFKENRVRNGNYPQKFLNPDLMTSYGGRQVHILAKKRIVALNNAWAKATGKSQFRLACGMRDDGDRRYAWLRGDKGKRYRAKKGPKAGQLVLKEALELDPNISTAALFDIWLIGSYGSIRSGRQWRAFNSAHETGLAFDISYGSYTPKNWVDGSMGPKSATNDLQKEGKIYKWIRANAHKYGISPYKKEAWHWEVQLTRKAWYTGEDFVKDGNYAIYVVEESPTSQLVTNDKRWSGRGFV